MNKDITAVNVFKCTAEEEQESKSISLYSCAELRIFTTPKIFQEVYNVIFILEYV